MTSRRRRKQQKKAAADFELSVTPGPVRGVLSQNGVQLANWEDLDLSQPWFWVPPVPQPPADQEVPDSWPEGWIEMGYTVDE